MGACMTESQKGAKKPKAHQAERRDKLIASSFVTNRSSKEVNPTESTISTRQSVSLLRATEETNKR